MTNKYITPQNVIITQNVTIVHRYTKYNNNILIKEIKLHTNAFKLLLNTLGSKIIHNVKNNQNIYMLLPAVGSKKTTSLNTSMYLHPFRAVPSRLINISSIPETRFNFRLDFFKYKLTVL